MTDAKVKAVERVVSEALRRAGVFARVESEPRDDPAFWTVGAACDLEAAGVAEAEWDKVVADIDAELGAAAMVASDAFANIWMTGLKGGRRRKVAAWRVDLEGRGDGR